MKETMHLKTVLFSLFILGVVAAQYSCQKATSASIEESALYRHPLDPLDSNEIKSVKAILLKAGKIDTTYRFFLINLQEPPKEEVLAYKAGQPYRREAFASVYNFATNKTSEAIVDLKTNSVLSFETIPGVQPGSFDKDSTVEEIVVSDPRWLKGLATRGIPLDSVKAIGVLAGEMGIGPKDHREFVVSPRWKNKKAGPIQGLFAYVDLTDKKVLKVLDDGGKSFSEKTDIGYFKADSARLLLEAAKPIRIEQPEGQGFKVEGQKIISKTWSFRIGLHNREGLVIYDARYIDKGKERPVLYRGSMAEMFVPYGSPDLGLSAWNYFDGGTYRMGQVFTKDVKALKVGSDVPVNSVLFPATMHDEKGMPIRKDSMVAVYEEFGGPLTRHGSFSTESHNLVVKYFTTIGNYDYAFRWIFREDGQISVDADLTGIIGIKAVNRVVDTPGGADPTYDGQYYGTLVTPHIEGVNHQHFFSFRLDMDVDGPANNIEEMNTMAVPSGPQNPYGNAMIMKMTPFLTESQARRSQNTETNRHWMIANGQVSNSLGHHSGYVLMPGHNAKLFANASSAAKKMGDIYEHQVWATAYNAKERHPAGDYPVSRGIVDGLPAWSANNESLVNKDVVLWYNTGITHIVRPEDWPVMNVHTMSFTLMPFGFFDQNPAVGMPNRPKPKPVVASIDGKVPFCNTPPAVAGKSTKAKPALITRRESVSQKTTKN